MDPKQLIGKYIPNLTGMPFELLRAYFEEVGKLTGSEEINRILGLVSRFLEMGACIFRNRLTPLDGLVGQDIRGTRFDNCGWGLIVIRRSSNPTEREKSHIH